MSLKNYVIPFALFVALASPAAFKLTHKALGRFFVSTEGVASFPGLLFHALVFVLLVGFLMRRVSRYATADQANAKGYIHYQKRQFIA